MSCVHGLQARADRGARLRRRPRQGVLRRPGRLQRRPRPPGQRGHALRAAHAARLGVLDLDRRGLTDAAPGSVKGLQLVVDDIEAARAELAGRGVDVSRDPALPVGCVRLLLRPGRERLGGPGSDRDPSRSSRLAEYSVNPKAVARAEQPIDARQYVLQSEWGRRAARTPPRSTPSSRTLVGGHELLAPRVDRGRRRRDQGASTRSSYGDFRRVHRMALIACVYRASEWRHKEIELAAHDLLQRLDALTASRTPSSGPAGGRSWTRCDELGRLLRATRRELSVPLNWPPLTATLNVFVRDFLPTL